MTLKAKRHNLNSAVRNGKTKGGKKQRFKSQDGSTFVEGDAREKKTSKLDKLLIFLLAQPKRSYSQIGVLFGISKERVRKILGEMGSINEDGVNLEVDMENASVEIFTASSIRAAFNDELKAHAASDWIMAKIPNRNDDYDTYLLRALQKDVGGSLYFQQKYENVNDPSIKFQMLVKLGRALSNPNAIAILQLLNGHGELSRNSINQHIQVHRGLLTTLLKNLLEANLIESKLQPKRYCINARGIKYFENKLEEVIHQPFDPGKNRIPPPQ